MRHQYVGAEPHLRAPANPHHSTDPAMPRSVPIPDPPGSGLDARPHPDLVPVQHTGRAERAGMAGSADGSRRAEIRAARQLLCVDGGLWTGAETDEPTGGEELDGVAQWFSGAAE